MNQEHRTARLLPALLATALAAGFATTTAIPAQELKVLSAADAKALNKKAREWFEAWRKYEFESDSPKERRAAGRAMTKAKEGFQKDWESKAKKGDPMSSLADLRMVFDNVFPYPRMSSSGVLKMVAKSEESGAYGVFVPKRYDSGVAYRSVVLLPGFNATKGSWTDPKDHFDATWATSSVVEETLFLIPALDAGIDLDPQPDFSTPGAEDAETKRIRAVLGSSGQFQRDLNVDRERMILDAGEAASGFALRLASYFPHRFAGLVLRAPVDVTGELRLGSLRGIPVLLVSSADTKDACNAIATKLNELAPDACKIIEGSGSYPYTASQSAIDDWAKGVRRNTSPTKVVIEPNHDAFNDAYWVLLGVTDSLVGIPNDQRPRLVVEANKEANRIKVEARGVNDFMLLLNDELVDLDQEFTVEVNGQLFKEKRSRSLSFLVDRMQLQFDPTWTFTTSFSTTVSKVEPTNGDAGK